MQRNKRVHKTKQNKQNNYKIIIFTMQTYKVKDVIVLYNNDIKTTKYL